MKLLSYIAPDGSRSYGILSELGIVDLYRRIGKKYPDLKSFLSNERIQAVEIFLRESVDFDLADITFLPVIENPGKILCVGMNYQMKRKEFSVTSDAPTIFIRFPDSQTAHLGEIIKPSLSEQLDYEGELAIIIGEAGRNIPQNDALHYVAGYSCYMDATARDWQHTWFTAGKNWPCTGGFGPWMVTRNEISDPQKLHLKTWLNGQVVQDESTSNMVRTVAEIISYVSTFTPLSPGDVILTGSPGGVGRSRTPPLYLKEGDIIEVEIDGIGRLTNHIVAQQI